MQTCRACGKATTDDAKFCPTCGTYFPAATQPAPGAPPAPLAPPAPSPAPAWGVPANVRARPLGVLILSLFYLVAGGLAVLAGLLFAVIGSVLSQDPQVRQQIVAGGVPGDLVAPLVAFFTVILVVFGVLGLILGWGMWHGRPWSWTLAVALQVVGIAFGGVAMLVDVATGSAGSAGARLVGIAIGAFLLWYFFQPGVRAWFGKQGQAEPGLPSYVPPPPSPPPGG
jgi:hypothetical protein